jgi:protein SCO1
MKGMRYLSVLCLLVLLLVGTWSAVAHHDASAGRQEEQPSQLQPSQVVLSPAHRYFTDVVLVNQYGERMRLYSDLLKGKIVLINSFFTSCEGSCPVVIGNIARIQDWLGDRLGRDVHLISVSVDPVTDTPAKLKAYAEQLKAKPGWYLLTGEKQNVEWALYKLGHYVTASEDHRNIIIIGNEPTGLWKKAFGLAPLQDIIQLLDGVLQEQG